MEAESEKDASEAKGAKGDCQMASNETISNIRVFPEIGVPQNGWFIMENPIKMDDLGGTIIFGNTHKYPKFCFGRPQFITTQQGRPCQGRRLS